MGNRQWKASNIDSLNYNYNNSLKPNQLTNTHKIGQYNNFGYNDYGAVNARWSSVPETDSTWWNIDSESFEYNMNGSLREYTHFIWEKGDIVDTVQYKYKYSFLGGREQKQQTKSTHGDLAGYAHEWTYYLLGAAGEQHAIYTGRNVGEVGPCGYAWDGNPLIFAQAYLTNGGEMMTLPDSTKEYNITDNMGNVRCVVSWKDSIKSIKNFDYLPYGGILDSSDNVPLLSYLAMERDREHGYTQMGRRLYDSETGRFMSVDPLYEAFSGHSPYHYAFNSPLIFRDPTGLAPEEEEKKERVYENEMLELVGSYYIGIIIDHDYGTGEVSIMSNYFLKGTVECVADRYDDGENMLGGVGKSKPQAPAASPIQTSYYTPIEMNVGSGNRGIPVRNIVGPYDPGVGSNNGSYNGSDAAGGSSSGAGSSSNQSRDATSAVRNEYSSDPSIPMIQGDVSTNLLDGYAFATLGLFTWIFGCHNYTDETPMIVDDTAISRHLQNMHEIGEARDAYYEKFVGLSDEELMQGHFSLTEYGVSFGADLINGGPLGAGIDPVEQFVGSTWVTIYNNKDELNFIIYNCTSIRSAAYHIIPINFDTSFPAPMKNFHQLFFFKEKVDFNKFKR
jgi:RHS repeat-associated protein